MKTRFAISVLAAFAIAPVTFAQDADDDVIEEIVTTGIRSSLEAAADLKRNDSRIIDAVVAEDIGKLPDNNIAEALARITGVSINREYGVGTEVSIRGLPDNRVEINGRTTLGDDRNGISLDDMPSAFLSAVEVIKSPTPEMIEGALGGTVNMRTVKPLDLKESVFSLSFDAEYADKTENWAPIINGTYGNIWDLDGGGTFGVTASISHQERELRQDTFQNDLRVQDGFDWNNDGMVDAADPVAQNTPSGNYVISREHKYEPWVEHRERTAANVSLQWAPNDRGNLYLDLSVAERSGGEEAYSVLMAGGSATNANGGAFEDSNGQLTNYTLEGAFILPKTWSEFRETDTFSHALGGEFDVTDKLQIGFEFSTAESDQVEPKSEFNWRAHDPVAEALDPAAQNLYNVDALIDAGSGNRVPGVTFIGDPGIYLDADRLALREFRHLTADDVNKEDALRLDLEYSNPGGLEWFTALKGGIRTAERESEFSRAEFRSANLHQDLTSATDPNDYIVWTMSEFDALFPGTLVSPYGPGDLFDQAGYSSPNQTAPFMLFDAARLSGNLEGTFDIIQQLLQGTNREVSGSLKDNLAFQESSYRLIEEDTSALYLQADLDFEGVRVVLGGRYVETDVSSSAFQDGVLVTDKDTYDDFLPSINISVDLSDNTILRASGAKVMRRGGFGDLSPSFDFNSDLILADRGNPGLEPFRANQFDFGVEHYWEGNMLSATVFYKDVSSFLKESIYCAYFADGVPGQNHADGAFDGICILPAGVTQDSFTFTDTDDRATFDAYVAEGRNGVKTTTVTNGANGKIQGFEVGTVYNFDHLPGAWSGLGINANYTYSDSEDPNGVALEDISENTYNIQLYWEYQDWSARLAYTSRDRFLDETGAKRTEHIGRLVESNTIDTVGDPTQGNNFRNKLEQLDAAASWNATDKLTIVGSITNLTGEPLINSSVTGTTWQVQESDRRFSLGARYTF
ncbi:MAG: TonB-dependent receptor [Woeseiaceae bacterium]